MQKSGHVLVCPLKFRLQKNTQAVIDPKSSVLDAKTLTARRTKATVNPLLVCASCSVDRKS